MKIFWNELAYQEISLTNELKIMEVMKKTELNHHYLKEFLHYSYQKTGAHIDLSFY